MPEQEITPRQHVEEADLLLTLLRWDDQPEPAELLLAALTHAVLAIAKMMGRPRL